MNVYVRELVSALAQAGVYCTVYVRTWRDGLPAEVAVEPGFRVRHIDAGPPVAPEGGAARDGRRVRRRRPRRPRTRRRRRRHPRELLALGSRRPPPEARARSAARVDVPHARPREGRVGRRGARATRALRGRDHRLLRRDPRELHRGSRAVRAPVRRDARSRRDRAARRRPRVLLARRPARRAHRARPRRPSGAAVRRTHPGAEGPRRRGARARRARRSGRGARRRRWSEREGRRRVPRRGRGAGRLARRRRRASASSPPQPHHLLSSYYRAADVCLVPSRSESFGLVALEAAACGTPVVAAAVGGLRTLVDHGHSGLPRRGPRSRGVRGLHGGAADEPGARRRR